MTILGQHLVVLGYGRRKVALLHDNTFLGREGKPMFGIHRLPFPSGRTAIVQSGKKKLASSLFYSG